MVGRLQFSTESDFGALAVMSQAIWAFELENHAIVWANAAALRFWGAESVADLRARDFSSDSPSVRRRLRAIFDRTPFGQSVQDAWTLYPKGEAAPVEIAITPVSLGANALDGLLIEASIVDLTTRTVEDQRLIEAMRATGTMISQFRLNGDVIWMNPAAVAEYGLAEKGAHTQPRKLLDRFLNRDDGEALIAKCRATGEATEELEALTLNGRRWHRFNLQNCVDPIGGEPNLLLIEDDQSERKAAVIALEAANATLEERVVERSQKIEESTRNSTQLLALLRRLIDSLPVMIGYTGADGRVRLANESYAAWLGQSTSSVVGKRLADITGDRYKIALPFIERVLSGENVEFERSKVGASRERIVNAHYIPHFAKDGAEVVGYFTLMEDVTERKLMQAQLDQTQRLAAVGRLTGGVAHDFNNLLGVVMGNIDLLADRLEAGDPQAAAIMRAAERGAELTRSLLAFARNQKLSPRTITLAEIMPDIASMLSMALGENNRLEIDLEEGLWPFSADPSPLENALINLAFNARDAMPNGGHVTVAASNFLVSSEARPSGLDLPPGGYVKLTVTDTGAGMSDALISRAFEPFFTTKEVGVGSGLGLSLVYGFAKQSGGDVTIENGQDGGLTVSIYLPRADTTVAADILNPVAATDAEDPTGGIQDNRS